MSLQSRLVGFVCFQALPCRLDLLPGEAAQPRDLFGITLDPFIVFTSNAFAILGLRNLYFLLANAKDKFHFLGTGLAFVLMWIGVKMILPAINHDWKIPPLVSLFVVLSILTVSIVASLLHTHRNKKK